MARNSARIGRRRRVLKEEVLSAGSTASADLTLVPGDTPRYGAGANIENHPQITDLVPRKYRAVALPSVATLVLGVVAELAAYYSSQLAAILPAMSAAEISVNLAGRSIAWATAVVLLVAAGYARVIYSLRRHRVDDYRGRYRIWRLASWVAVALSFNAVVGGHLFVARVLGHFTSWSVLPGNAGWWLAAAVLGGGWLMLKLVFDAAECRAALAGYLLAVASFAVAGAVAGGWSPVWAGTWLETIARVLPMAGFVLLLTATLLFARYVVLDVQGLIEHKSLPAPAPAPIAGDAQQKTPVSEPEPAGNSAAPAASLVTDEQLWTDGTYAEGDQPSGKGRKLSKSERKRLRKHKSRNRAA